jgi:hypothetical protein
MIFYGLVPRETLIEGEWQDEPDLEIWDPGFPGIICMVKRAIHTGHLCGYVGIDNNKDRTLILSSRHELWVYGGVTFKGGLNDLPHILPNCFPDSEDPWMESYYLLGFDGAHSGDFCYLAKNLDVFNMPRYKIETTYKNWDFFRNECNQLALQIHNITNSQGDEMAH